MSNSLNPRAKQSMNTVVEIKLTIQVLPEKVNEVTDALLRVVAMKDVWNGKLEQGRVEIDFPITNEDKK